jgi:hypothetical protein
LRRKIAPQFPEVGFNRLHSALPHSALLTASIPFEVPHLPTPNAICFQELLHGGRNFHDMGLCRKMSGIEKLDLRVRQVFPKRLCSRGNEKGIKAAL